MAWLTTHLAALVVYEATLVGSMSAHPWRCLMLSVWLVGLSGLAIRTAGELRGSVDEGGGVVPRTRLPSFRLGPSLKANLFLLNAPFAQAVVSPLGSPARLGFLAVIALTIGARVAGLDAWAGIDRPPLHYLRSLFAWRSAIFLVQAVAITALVLWLMSRFVDPHLPDDGGRATQLLGGRLSRRTQFIEFTAGVSILAVPTIAECELISAIGRFHHAINARLAASERRSQRQEVAGVLHDRVLALAAQVRQRCVADDHRSLAAALENELRLLQVEQTDRRTVRSAAACMERGLAMATAAGIEVHLESSNTTLDVPLAGDRAWVLERLALVHIGNSQTAGARNAYIRLTTDELGLEFTYYDDGTPLGSAGPLPPHTCGPRSVYSSKKTSALLLRTSVSIGLCRKSTAPAS